VSSRVELEPAYVLHTRLYRETSLLVDCFSKDHGKICVIAKGARRFKSPQKGLLRPFMPLTISFLGRSDIKTLSHCELQAPVGQINGDRMAAGFYVNELLVRLLHPHMSFPELYHHYDALVQILSTQASYIPRLRVFEKNLLQVLGYELALRHDCYGEPIQAQHNYLYLPEQGLQPNPNNLSAKGMVAISGASVLALANNELNCIKSCAEVKLMLHAALKRLLGNRPIQSKFLLQGKTEKTDD
jgi:DNA repair protein RecO (recombination protein O)